MSESKKVFRGTMVLTVGRVTGYGLSFLRNLILARMLTKADYGLAAVFGMAVMLLEISGRMAFGVQIVQSNQGDTPGFQASAHALQFIGGTCSAVLIGLMSAPMARLFGVPHAWWAFALLAVVPLFQGLSHLDVSRRQRELDFVPLMMVDVVPQFLITVAAWPLALWLRDYRTIVWLMVGKSLLGTALSFVFARQPYSWAWNREDIRRMLAFGWPLLLTGLVMLGSQQADQMIVGAVFSLEVLANYSLAFSLVSAPWYILGQVGASLILPILSREQDNPERLRRLYRNCVQIVVVGGAVCTLPLIVSGEQVVMLLFGTKYRGTGAFVAILGAAFTVRFLRFVPAVAALAKADTMNQLYSNLSRLISLPLALLLVVVGGSPLQIAACAVVGEVFATVVSVVRLWRRQGVPLKESYGASVYVAILVTLGVTFALLGGAGLKPWIAVGASVAAASISLCLAWFMFPEISRLAIQTIWGNSRVSVEQPAPS